MTTTLLPILFQLDITAANPANRVTNEAHTLPPNKRRAIAPNHGIFYKEGVVIRDVGNANRVLAPSEYSFGFLQSIPSARIGKEVFAVIIIENPLVSTSISLDVQMVGGEYSRNYIPIVEMINILLADTRPITYPNIIDKPIYFDPVTHLHALEDSLGYEYLMSTVTRLRDTILTKNMLGIENLLDFVEAKTKGSNDKIAQNSLDIIELFQTSSNLNTDYIVIQGLFTTLNENLAESNLAAAAKIAQYQAETT